MPAKPSFSRKEAFHWPQFGAAERRANAGGSGPSIDQGREGIVFRDNVPRMEGSGGDMLHNPSMCRDPAMPYVLPARKKGDNRCVNRRLNTEVKWGFSRFVQTFS